MAYIAAKRDGRRSLLECFCKALCRNLSQCYRASQDLIHSTFEGMEWRMDMDMGVVERRTALAEMYSALPPYASAAFWCAVEDPTIPLEILVKILRAAITSGDEQGRRRILEWIILRTQAMNLLWAQRVLQMLSLQSDERSVLARDLCADLHECMMRALADLGRLFW